VPEQMPGQRRLRERCQELFGFEMTSSDRRETGASHAVTERRTRTLRDRVHTFYEAGIGTHASGQLDTYG